MEEKDIKELYADMMSGYEDSPLMNREWPMKDGMYQQYSAFETDVKCSSGTNQSITML